MAWLAIHLPLLSLEAFAATLPASERALPLALVAQHRITAVDPSAAGRGVRVGLKRATALALTADLRLGQADAARDAAALQAVAHAALAFTPMVVADDAAQGAATVLLGVASVLRYHGGAERLRARLQDALAPLGHRLQLAAAPTPAGAALLARWRDGFASGPHATDLAALQALLDGAPVWLLGPGRAHWDALQGMGLHTLADLRALPRAGLARRFGATLLAELDRARGDAPDPREPVTAPPVFESRLELFARADTTDQVLHGAAVLLARLLAWAQARQSRIVAFTLRMQHERLRRSRDEDAPAHTDLTVELAEPGADAAQLNLLLRERLARCPLPAPTLELRLRCRRLVQAPPPSGDLFPTRQSQHEGLVRLLERLRARLGDDQVLRLQPLADHRPERASRWQAGAGAVGPAGAGGQEGARGARGASGASGARGASGAGGPGGAGDAGGMAGVGAPLHPAGGAATLPLHRPAWLLPEPQRLPERAALPLLDGRPLQIVSGPERIEAGWWDAGPGGDAASGGGAGGLAARDYFIARTDDGALVWIFRTRLAAPDGWFLQGRFG